MCVSFSFRNSYKNEHKEFLWQKKIILILDTNTSRQLICSSDDEENFVPSTHVAANASFNSDSSKLDEDVSEESSGDHTIDDIHVCQP